MTNTDAVRKQLVANERRQTAHHEAGHGVAAVWRGGTFHSISIEQHGLTHAVYERRHRDFIIFAGPWGEARADWGERALDDVDSVGQTFHHYLRAAMRVSASDLRLYEPDRDVSAECWDATFSGSEPPEIPLARDQSWYAELELCWPTIQSVAGMLLSGVEVTPEYVRTSLGLISE